MFDIKEITLNLLKSAFPRFLDSSFTLGVALKNVLEYRFSVKEQLVIK